MILLWLAAKYGQRHLYVILRRSGTKKNKGEISPPVFLGKGKKSIDLESVVDKFSLKLIQIRYIAQPARQRTGTFFFPVVITRTKN